MTDLGLQKTFYKWTYADLKSPFANYYVQLTKTFRKIRGRRRRFRGRFLNYSSHKRH